MVSVRVIVRVEVRAVRVRLRVKFVSAMLS